MGFDQNTDNLVMQCMEEKRDFYFIDHAYFDRGYEAGNFRVIKNAVHQNTVKPAQSQRELKPWRKGEFIVVIPPTPKIAKVLGADGWVERTVATLKTYTNRKIIVKAKDPIMPLPLYIESALALVSFASVAEVEAAVYGVPVFVSSHSPAAPVGNLDLSRIENPLRPDRRAWLNSLCASQFHMKQMAGAWRALNGI
jgi:hypothetical protein